MNATSSSTLDPGELSAKARGSLETHLVAPHRAQHIDSSLALRLARRICAFYPTGSTQGRPRLFAALGRPLRFLDPGAASIDSAEPHRVWGLSPMRLGKSLKNTAAREKQSLNKTKKSPKQQSMLRLLTQRLAIGRLWEPSLLFKNVLDQRRAA